MSETEQHNTQNNNEPVSPNQNNNEESQTKQQEQQKEQEVSYDSLIVTLKEKNKEIKKLETFKNKIEKRYKEQVKVKKELNKEKTALEEFVKSISPSSKLEQCVDSNGKYLDAELLKKTWSECKTSQQDQSNQDDMVQILREQNENLKQKIMELSSLDASQMTDHQKQIKGYEQLLKEKDYEIEKFKHLEKEYNELKGMQLLSVFKTGKNEGASHQGTDVDEINQLKQQLSEKTNRILELTENLQQANETIQAIENNKNYNSKPVTPVNEEQNNDNTQNMMSVFDKTDENEEISQLNNKVLELEHNKTELQEKLEQDKMKARNLLIKKDVSEYRLKLIISKFENYLRSQLKMSHDQIHKISQLKEDDYQKLQQIEQELQEDLNPLESQRNQQNIQTHQQNHAIQQKEENKESVINTEYIRNVFVKYLEYLAGNNQKEIRTIEHVLFTELQVTKDQAARIDHLRRQNTFWKKFLLATSQPVVKNKFSAGVFKKKLFGVNILHQGQGNQTERSSIGGAPNDIMNKSILTPSLNSTQNHINEFENDFIESQRIRSDSGNQSQRFNDLRMQQTTSQKVDNQKDFE